MVPPVVAAARGTRLTPGAWVATALAVLYPWCLPALAAVGFAESGATTVSGFIANPQATGAMAAVSFLPLELIVSHQHCVLRCDPQHGWMLNLTQQLFLVSYALFLVCTVTYNKTAHAVVVLALTVSFIAHAWHVWLCVHRTSTMLAVTLWTGAFSFTVLGVLFLGFDDVGLVFWGFECLGFSAMVLYTPLCLLADPALGCRLRDNQNNKKNVVDFRPLL